MLSKKRISKLSVVTSLILGCLSMSFNSSASELIVLAAPDGKSQGDYYLEVEEQIFEFHLAYAKEIMKHDRVLILASDENAADYIEALGSEHVLLAPMSDIWMRDFTLSNVSAPLMFRYTAAAQDNQSAADNVQDVFYDLVKSAGINFTESDLLNDGGNFVDDYFGNVVISTKFLKDNNLTETKARKLLTAIPSINNVAFITADEQGGLEHSDGVVSFIDENTLMINSYPEDPEYAKILKQQLKRGLPNVVIQEIPTPYDDSKIYDSRFGSACGLYTNALVTPHRIYLPQFGIPEDKKVLTQVRSLTDKQVVPVRSDNVCIMGGGVRCMSWQVRGEYAEKLIQLQKTRQSN